MGEGNVLSESAISARSALNHPNTIYTISPRTVKNAILEGHQGGAHHSISMVIFLGLILLNLGMAMNNTPSLNFA